MKRLAPSEVHAFVKCGIRDFISSLHDGRRVTICGFDLDCGCTGFAHVWNAEGEDYEYLDSVDLSCLAEFICTGAH